MGKGLRFGVPPDNSTRDVFFHNMLNLRKALLGRIDLFAFPEVSFAHRVQELQLQESDFEQVIPRSALSVPLWLLISKNSDPQLVAQLQKSAKALKARGRLQALISGHALLKITVLAALALVTSVAQAQKPLTFCQDP